MSWFGNLIKRIGSSPAPNQVLEVSTAKYDNSPIIVREENIVLYAIPRENSYEIIMQKPISESTTNCYSLYRTDDRAVAERRFSNLMGKLLFLCKWSLNSIESIQKYCDMIEEQPTWNLCHLIVYFSIKEALPHPIITSLINSSDSKTGFSPLQLAVREANVAMIKLLLNCGASVEHLDHEGNSVFHYAAMANKDIVNLLAETGNSPRVLSLRNIYGSTALHVACRSDKPDCVTALISNGLDVNISATSSTVSTSSPYYTAGIIGDFSKEFPNKLKTEEMKNGGTPIHWSASKEIIITLLERNCDINALNFANQTALHVMVMRNRLDCVIALLSREAEINLVDDDGNTALHMAAKEKNIPIIQALLTFGCDFNLINNAGETARHIAAVEGSEVSLKIVYILHAVGAKRCSSIMNYCTSHCKADSIDNGIPPPPASGPTPRVISDILKAESCNLKPGRGARVLSLDGGGIRGLVLIVILLHLEEVIGRPIVHCFDWIAATSTGGILALALAAGKTLKEALCIYFRMKDDIFQGRKPYNSEPLESLLKDVLGNDTTMADIMHPKLMIMGCLADRKPVDLHIFRNYENASEILSGWVQATPTCPTFKPMISFRNQLLWEAARASGAAPSYFRCHDRFVDGGLVANNPTLDAITELHEYNTALKAVGRHDEVVDIRAIVSVGTGSIPLVKKQSMDIHRPSGLMDMTMVISSVSTLHDVLVDQATQTDGRVIDRTRAVCSMMSLPYFRFSPQLSEDIAMDEKDDVKLVNMLWETKAYILSQSDFVNKLAEIINI
ncbi:85/88 kDa calcium-independent phospholipase A2 isoform X2 [Cimex lectularius]|uniref:phospholipase A2 n=1 Tax=Cimex lectularius TaxID=79782 RepID=A0A8I6SIL3_CIMLE|nr:85/88 kDa calcium-independent phospholipase A2 isoform X2 [Cimex lectularius]